MSKPRLAPPPPALGAVDLSEEAAALVASVAQQLRAVVRHRTLSPAQQVQALLLVAANIASAVPSDQLAQACDFYCTDAALRWHHATEARLALLGMVPAGSA
jgi:hypothetical protein